MWPWVNTNYHQNWVGEHPNNDYYIHWNGMNIQGYRVLTHTHVLPSSTPWDPGRFSRAKVYSRGIVGLTLEAWLDACRGLSLPFSRHEARLYGWGMYWLCHQRLLSGACLTGCLIDVSWCILITYIYIDIYNVLHLSILVGGLEDFLFSKYWE